MTFDQAFDILMEHEGGYSNHPHDPGGETMWGCTARFARSKGYHGSMRDLPKSLAAKWFRETYWDLIKLDALPGPLRYPMFDAAINSGQAQAVKWLQRALGVKDDGAIGPITIAKAHELPLHLTRAQMIGRRLEFMAGLSTWSSFGKGWARRIASLLQM